jgi:hypothetical protein
MSPERARMLLSDARQFRSRAEELRATAEDMQNEYCREAAGRLADDYDRMARHAERRAAIGNSEGTAGPTSGDRALWDSFTA